MATSRTGTASHKRWRLAVLSRDRSAGITHCPLCSVQLDYDQSRKPDSAEPDHIVAWEFGGQNVIENGRTICRQCNQRRGNGRRESLIKARSKPKMITKLLDW